MNEKIIEKLKNLDEKTLKKIGIVILILIFIWFVFFRKKELTVTYDGISQSVTSYGYDSGYNNSLYRNTSAKLSSDLAFTNYAVNSISEDAVEGIVDESAGDSERYNENHYYRVNTNNFEKAVDDIKKIIEDSKGIIKTNSRQTSDKEYYDLKVQPRYQSLVFQIDNAIDATEKIELSLSKYGKIVESNSNKSSIESKITDYQNRLKELEAKREALKTAKPSREDSDRITREDSRLAGEIERIKNDIDKNISSTTYKTYVINIYETIKIKVNALKYWYSNNYEVQREIENVLPTVIKIFTIVLPLLAMIVLFIYFLNKTLFNNNVKKFEEKMKIVGKEFKDKNITMNIKM